jgi:creatinine amidohydrolase/Fe(II)-dependent formamide hydrolase-like protein
MESIDRGTKEKLKVRLFKTLLLISVAIPSFTFAEQLSDSVFIEEMTWTEVRDAIKAGKTAIIFPTGGTEQNGPHMVLGKHNFIVKYAAEQIAQRLGNALVAPVLAYVPESFHMSFPGTIDLPDEYFMKVAEYAARSFKVNGFKHIILIGDSGGNQMGLMMVAMTLNEEWADTDVRVNHIADYYNASYPSGGAFFKWLESQGEKPEDIGQHAGITDTSQLMAINPRLIRMNKREAGRSTPGVSGDPTRANIAYGKKGLELKIQAAVAQIKQLIAAERK